MYIYTNTIPTEKQIENYKPTYLYIKEHNVTGLKYFGKTTAKDPCKYKGSGVYWSRHLSNHGNDVTTTIVGYYTDIHKLTENATKISVDNDIVGSKDWANIKQEDGLMGGETGGKGKKRSPETIEKMRLAATGRKHSTKAKEKMKQTRAKPEVKEKMRLAATGVKKSAETIEKLRAGSTGRKHSAATKEKMRQSHLARFSKK
jgi:hypothetical protein